MHVYIYDGYVNSKKYDNITAKIETRITDLGLNGKIIRLGALHSVYNCVEDEIKKGAKTIVAVGNIKILNQTINALTKFLEKTDIDKIIPLGFIPVGKKFNNLAKQLGINSEDEACDILSARRIETLDLGKVNENYFLFQATISTKNTSVEIDQNYTIEIIEAGEIGIINLPLENVVPTTINAKANDGIMELLIKTKEAKKFLPINNKLKNKSVFSFSELNIINHKEPIVLDDSINIPTPVKITIAKPKINLIVGKNRIF